MSFHHAVESEFAGPMAGLIITADMHGFVVGFVAPRRLRGVLRWWGGVLNAWSMLRPTAALHSDVYTCFSFGGCVQTWLVYARLQAIGLNHPLHFMKPVAMSDE